MWSSERHHAHVHPFMSAWQFLPSSRWFGSKLGLFRLSRNPDGWYLLSGKWNGMSWCQRSVQEGLQHLSSVNTVSKSRPSEVLKRFVGLFSFYSERDLNIVTLRVWKESTCFRESLLISRLWMTAGKDWTDNNLISKRGAAKEHVNDCINSTDACRRELHAQPQQTSVLRSLTPSVPSECQPHSPVTGHL